MFINYLEGRTKWSRGPYTALDLHHRIVCFKKATFKTYLTDSELKATRNYRYALRVCKRMHILMLQLYITIPQLIFGPVRKQIPL